MLLPVLIFGFVSLVTLGAAVVVVTNKNILHSAFYLILAFVGVAAVYVLLEAPFIAVVQVLVYIGAIAILIVFAIMLTRRLMSKDMEQQNSQWIPSTLGALALFLVLAWITYTAGWPVHEGAVPAEILAQRLGSMGIECEAAELVAALHDAEAWAAESGGAVCVVGSLFLAGAVRESRGEL